MTDAFPPVGQQPWELRFTRRALDDLGASGAADRPGDLASIRQLTTYSRVVDDFVNKRTEQPDGPGDALHSVGRSDIISLHSAAGGRAATWHDADNGVVWLLGFTPNHDYTLFEQRARNGTLLPDEDDEVLLELEREQRDFQTRIRPGLEELLARAIEHTGHPQRGTVGGLLRLEISALVIQDRDIALGDVWLVVHLPLREDANGVPGWPGPDLLATLASLVGEGDLDYTTTLPDAEGEQRRLDPAAEMAIVVRNVTLPVEALQLWMSGWLSP